MKKNKYRVMICKRFILYVGQFDIMASIQISSFKTDSQGKPLDRLTNTVRNCKLR